MNETEVTELLKYLADMFKKYFWPIYYTMEASNVYLDSVQSIYLSLPSEDFLGNMIVKPFLLLQQTAVQSSILFLSRTIDMILQTCSVVKKSTPHAAAI